MKHFACIIMLLLACLPPIVAQESSDSAFWDAEKEDTLGLLSIKPVKHPKKLLKQIFERFNEDLKETHMSRRYIVEGTFRQSKFPPFSAKGIYTVEGDNGLEIMGPSQNIKTSKLELLHYEGPDSLTSQDSITLISLLRDLLLASPVHRNHKYDNGCYPVSPFVYYEETNRWYDKKAYDIEYGSDNGVYRIQLVKKKNRYLWTEHDREHWLGDYKVTAYFDRRTLRITQFKGEFTWEVAEYPFNLGSNSCTRFLADYDNIGGKPVLKRISYTHSSDSGRNITGTVQRIDSQ